MIVFQVPVSEIRFYLERKVQNLELELEILEAENRRRKEERISKGIPALQQRYEDVLKEWKDLPEKKKKRTMKPDFCLKFDRIVIYREEALGEQISGMLMLLPQKEKRAHMFIVEIINIEDLYEYEHKNDGGRIFEIKAEIAAFRRRIRNLDSDIDFHEELTQHEMEVIGLNINNFRAVRHRTRLSV